jgi:ABC-2 type transport system permease protein
MRVYVEFVRRVFRRNAAYKVQYFMGLFNALLGLFIGVAIWRAAYGGSDMIEGISKQQMVTYAVLGVLMRTMLTMNEYLIDSKIRTGEIAVDLLKPYKFLGYVLSVIIGDMLFNLWTKVLPVLIVSILIFHLALPADPAAAMLFLLSLLLGFLVLYGFNLIFWLSAFWVHQTWSIMTIKNAVILLVSGATIPLWFMPHALATAFAYLPFKDIYFTPLAIYLGQVQGDSILMAFVAQLCWIIVLHGFAMLLWNRAQTKLVIQGG